MESLETRILLDASPLLPLPTLIGGLGTTAHVAYDLSASPPLGDPGLQLSETVADGTTQAATTRFVYQGNNRTAVIDPDGNVTTYAYDAKNRVISVTDTLGHTQTQTYDANGNVASITNRDGLRRDFTYDAQNRETGEVWYAAGGLTVTNEVAYTYDGQGRPTSAGDASGSYTFGYDANGRVASLTGPFEVSLTFGYDANGNRIRVQDSFGGTTTSQYDSANELVDRWFSQVGTPLLGITQQFDDSGNVVRQTRSDGFGATVLNTAFGRDTAGHLTSLVYARGDGSVIADYASDTSSLPSSQTAGSTTGDNGLGHTFDANGNRTDAGYVTGPDNRLLSDGVWNYAYDADGNTVGKVSTSTGESWVYGYDAKDRMVSAVLRDATGVFLTQARYAYDVYDHRIVSVVMTASGVATETHFAYDGDHLYALLDAGNHLVKRYVSLDALDSAFVRIGRDGLAWLLADRLGSIRDIVDNTGALLDHREFDVWGNLSNETNASQADQIGYAGYFYDVTVSQYQVWHRWYDATTGRWTQKDPMGFAAGDSNLYRYVGNDVTGATDPTGLIAKSDADYGAALRVIWAGIQTANPLGLVGSAFGLGWDIQVSLPESTRVWGYEIYQVSNAVDRAEAIVYMVSQIGAGVTEIGPPWGINGLSSSAILPGGRTVEWNISGPGMISYFITPPITPAPDPVPNPIPVPVAEAVLAQAALDALPWWAWFGPAAAAAAEAYAASAGGGGAAGGSGAGAGLGGPSLTPAFSFSLFPTWMFKDGQSSNGCPPMA